MAKTPNPNVLENISELDELRSLSALLESVESRLQNIFADMFPLNCGNCEKIFHNLEHYLDNTDNMRDIKKNNSTYIEETREFIEFRNCACGSTITLMGTDRRDSSEAGDKRRELFEVSVKKVMDVSGADEEQARSTVRDLFRKIIRG